MTTNPSLEEIIEPHSLPLDRLDISGIRAYGYVGAFPEENVLGQWFEVDITLWYDLSVAGESDRLEDTLNYVSTVQTVQHLIKTSKFALIERLATAIANAILEAHPIQQVQVRLTKLTPPIPDFSGSVSITLLRRA